MGWWRLLALPGSLATLARLGLWRPGPDGLLCHLARLGPVARRRLRGLGVALLLGVLGLLVGARSVLSRRALSAHRGRLWLPPLGIPATTLSRAVHGLPGVCLPLAPVGMVPLAGGLLRVTLSLHWATVLVDRPATLAGLLLAVSGLASLTSVLRSGLVLAHSGLIVRG